MKRSSVLFTLALLSASFTVSALAQESDSDAHQFKIFAEFSAAHPGQGAGYIWGGSGGAYLQGGLLGLVVRGTATPSGNSIRMYSAVAGPRLAADFRVIRAYIEAGGGMGHSGYYDAYGNIQSAWAPAWQADAGANRRLLPRLDWRILEVAYGRIYAGPGVSPVIVSTGLALHLW